MKLNEVKVHFKTLEKFTEGTYPVKMSFAISKNLEALEKEFIRSEEEREKICEMYAEKDKDGKSIIENRSYVFSAENLPAVDKAYKELMEEEVEVDIRKITEADVEKCDTDKRYTIPSAGDIAALAFMIE